MKNGQSLDRLIFFILILFLFCHIFGCVYIFVARSLEDPDYDEITWIYSNNLESASPIELYTATIYFTMQTLTTVGYGDLDVSTYVEKITVVLL